MVGKNLLRTVILSSALAGGLLTMAGTAPAFADSQNHGRLVQTNLNQSAIHNDGRDYDGDRHSWHAYDRDSDKGRYYHNNHNDSRDLGHDRRFDRDHDRGDRDRH